MRHKPNSLSTKANVSSILLFSSLTMTRKPEWRKESYAARELPLFKHCLKFSIASSGCSSSMILISEQFYHCRFPGICCSVYEKYIMHFCIHVSFLPSKSLGVPICSGIPEMLLCILIIVCPKLDFMPLCMRK